MREDNLTERVSMTKYLPYMNVRSVRTDLTTIWSTIWCMLVYYSFILFFRPHITLCGISTYIGCRSLQSFNLNVLSTEYFIAWQLLTTVKYDWLSDRTGRLCGNHCIWLSNNFQVTHCKDSFINHRNRFSLSCLLIQLRFLMMITVLGFIHPYMLMWYWHHRVPNLNDHCNR